VTPFGERLRELRRRRGLTLKAMAADLEVSPAYLSALEHGRRGRPSPGLVQLICASYELIWDDTEELHRLARLSHPRAVVDTAGLGAAKTELANRLAETIRDLPDDAVRAMLDTIEAAKR